jgi:hypothetical protein
MEEEEEEDADFMDYNADDVDDDADGSDDEGGGLQGHAKMVAFHAAIKAVLGRQLERMEQEVRGSGRLAALGGQEAEESARQLHGHQKRLVLEEDGVRTADTKLTRVTRKRTRRGEENGRFRVDVEKLEEEVEQSNLAGGDLREELNLLSGRHLHLQAVRLDRENQVTGDSAPARQPWMSHRSGWTRPARTRPRRTSRPGRSLRRCRTSERSQHVTMPP